MTSMTQTGTLQAKNQDPVENASSAVSLANALGQEMVPQTTLSTLRHYVENLLAAFARSVSINDANGLAQLLRHVRVQIRHSHVSGPAAVGEILETFHRSRPDSWMTTGNLSVGFVDNAVAYTATYQLWDSNTPHRCTEIGTFNGTLEAGPQVWYWREHEIIQPAAS